MYTLRFDVTTCAILAGLRPNIAHFDGNKIKVNNNNKNMSRHSVINAKPITAEDKQNNCIIFTNDINDSLTDNTIITKAIESFFSKSEMVSPEIATLRSVMENDFQRFIEVPATYNRSEEFSDEFRRFTRYLREHKVGDDSITVQNRKAQRPYKELDSRTIWH